MPDNAVPDNNRADNHAADEKFSPADDDGTFTPNDAPEGEFDENVANAYRSVLGDLDLSEDDLEVLDGDQEIYSGVLPVVAFVGRPNVGKSTLVNRILGRREAVVEDTPGVTRDRISYQASWDGRAFTLMDTGGWESDVSGMYADVAKQSEIAIDLADVVVLVVDAVVGATGPDEQMVRLLRRAGKPVILAANKVDDERQALDVAVLWGLGIGEPMPVSSLHGKGVADLLDRVVEKLPKLAPAPVGGGVGPRKVAIVGKPNVGKSSLLNKAVGAERVVVNDYAGTTRDPVDELVTIKGETWRFIDTAGIRRRAHLQQGSDYYASLRTAAALDRAEVAIVVIDVTEPISEQDVRIVDMVLQSGRALVLAFNKWDMLTEERRELLDREIEQDLAHVHWAPRVNLSAKTGRHLEKLVPALSAALEGWDTRIPTGKFNAFLQEISQSHPHPLRGGKQPRVLFGTQASNRPPKFVLFTTGFLDPGYRRYIVRLLRETYGFIGSPIDVSMRIRERRKDRR